VSIYNFMIVAGIVFIFIFLVVLFFLPTSEKKSKKRKIKNEQNGESVQKDWKEAHQRSEKHIGSLRNEIEKFKREKKDQEKNILVEKTKIEMLQEKLSQERGWHEKEHTTIDKRTQELQELSKELLKSQESLSKEHGLNLKLEREIKELKRDLVALNDERRKREAENAQLKAEGESQRQDMVELKKDNARLKKKNEDTTWIAKSEYTKLERLLKQKEKEIERIERELR